ncbi:MAG: hypothetical protein ABI599_04340 [Flavobacteriales bacterium]
MKRSLLLTIACVSLAFAHAQVQVDKPVRLVGAVPADRRIEGLAHPVEGSALSTLGVAQDGSLHMCGVTGAANNVLLTMDPPCLAYANGLLLRWIPGASNTGPATVAVDGSAAVPLRTSALLPVPLNALSAGIPAEAIFADSIFILLSPIKPGCPEGFLQANAGLCVMQAEGPVFNWYAAAAYCAERGARLCTWDQYLFVCNALQGQLTGMFDDWEWLDDTSDHTHTADQAARYTCKSLGVVSAGQTELGTTRCCYEPR